MLPTSLLPWGTNIILILQSWSHPLLDMLLSGVTLLGTEGFYMLLLPVLVWCLNKELGLRVALLVLVSTYLNQALKALIQSPRPDPGVVRWMVSAAGWGFPSGHAQTTTALFGYLMLWLRPRRWAVSLWLVPPLVSFSRVYLGVHYPHDVAGGMLAGLALLALYSWAVDGPPGQWWARLGVGWQGGTIAVATVALAAPGISSHAVTAMGTLMGIGWGTLWEQRVVGLLPRTSTGQQVLKLIAGLVLLLLLYGLGKMLLPDVPVLRFVRYAVLGAGVTGILPWLFLHWGWGESIIERTHASCAMR